MSTTTVCVLACVLVILSQCVLTSNAWGHFGRFGSWKRTKKVKTNPTPEASLPTLLKNLRASDKKKDATIQQLREEMKKKDATIKEFRAIDNKKDAAIKELRASGEKKNSLLQEAREKVTKMLKYVSSLNKIIELGENCENSGEENGKTAPSPQVITDKSNLTKLGGKNKKPYITEQNAKGKNNKDKTKKAEKQCLSTVKKLQMKEKQCSSDVQKLVEENKEKNSTIQKLRDTVKDQDNKNKILKVLSQTNDDGCPDHLHSGHWKFFEGTCYGYYTNWMTWDLSKSLCHSINGTLAEFHNKKTYDFLKTWVQSRHVDTWVGANNVADYDKPIWEGSGTPVNFTWWKYSKPGFTLDDRYGLLGQTGSGGLVLSSQKIYKRPKLCQKKPLGVAALRAMIPNTT